MLSFIVNLSCLPEIQTHRGLQEAEVEPSQGSRRAAPQKNGIEKVATQAEQLN
jgi:hypothetical protein